MCIVNSRKNEYFLNYCSESHTCVLYLHDFDLSLSNISTSCVSHTSSNSMNFFFKYIHPACKFCRILTVHAYKNIYFAMLIQCYSYGSVFRADLLELDNLSRWSSSLRTKYLSLENHLSYLQFFTHA